MTLSQVLSQMIEQQAYGFLQGATDQQKDNLDSVSKW